MVTGDHSATDHTVADHTVVTLTTDDFGLICGTVVACVGVTVARFASSQGGKVPTEDDTEGPVAPSAVDGDVPLRSLL
jgi:hypothetical protein